MKTMNQNDYTAAIIANLENAKADADRNYDAFKNARQQSIEACAALVAQGVGCMAPEMLDNTETRHACFNRMMELDAEAQALETAIRAIKNY